MANSHLLSYFFSLAIITILLLSSTLFPANADTNLVRAQTTDENIYDVIIFRNRTVGSTIWLIGKNNSLLLVPLEEVIDRSLINNMTPEDILGADPSDDAYVNLTLPDGKEVRYITYSLYRYYGFGEGSPKVWAITTKYFPRDRALWVVIHVLVPPPEDGNYKCTSALSCDRILIVYRYINETHFGVDIKFTDAYYGESAIPFDKSHKRFNITIRFIVNKSSWIAKYWNGNKWVPAGMLPIAGPALDLTNMLYKLYKAYNDTVNYYLTHRDQLSILINKIKTLLESGNHTEAANLVYNVSYAPIPQEWRALRATYLGKNYKYNPFTGSAVGEIVEFYNPPHTGLWWVMTDYKKFYDSKEELLSAVIDYLLNGTTEKLEDIIAENHAFAKYQPHDHKGGNGSLAWVFMGLISSGLPVFGGGLDMALPVNGLLGIPDILRNASYAIMSMSTAFSINAVEIIRNTSLPSIPSEEELGNDGYLAVAIDRRLTEEWMLTSNNSLDPSLRVGILQNLLNTVTNKYAQALYNIVSGADPEEAFKEFQSYLKTSVLAAAFQFGGESGKETLENLISGKKPTSSEEIPDNTTSEVPSGEDNVTNVSANNEDRRMYVVVGSIIGLITVAIVAFMVWSRRHK